MFLDGYCERERALQPAPPASALCKGMVQIKQLVFFIGAAGAAMPQSLSVAAGVASAKAASVCSARKNCHECSAPSNSSLCFWCYDSAKCLSVQSPLSGKVLHGCQTFSFTQTDCSCSEFKTCSECAHSTLSRAHLNPTCMWTNTTTNLTFTASVAGSIKRETVEIGARSSCREGHFGVIVCSGDRTSPWRHTPCFCSDAALMLYIRRL